MSEARISGCRLGECLARVKGTITDGALTRVEADPESVLGRHGLCAVCTGSAGAARDPRRLDAPLRRTDSGWERISWEQALDEIAERLKAIRREAGPSALGLYAGRSIQGSGRALVRTLAVGVAWGTPHVFGPLSHGAAPWLRATELMLGAPTPLQGDIGRAHYVVLVGANQEAQGWGPLQGGRNHASELAFSRKTKGTKVVTVDPRRTPEAARADLHLAVLPGTELFFVLGLLRSTLDQGWSDAQYLRDYCTPVEPLKEALAPWTLERCAAACGVAANEIQAVALKFGRAAMAVLHRSPQALGNTHGTLTAWAMLALHAVTANLMRPGGLHLPDPVLDPHPALAAVPTDRAPRLGELPLFLLQAPGAILADRAHAGGAERLRALVVVGGDPAWENPGGAKLRTALDQLDLLVALDVAHNHSTARAHYVLPITHPWERSELPLHLGALIAHRVLTADPALASPPGESRDAEAVLQALFKRVGPGFGRGAYGLPLRAAAVAGATLDLGPIEDLLLAQAGASREALEAEPHGWGAAEMDRSAWRVDHPSGRVELLPAAIAAALAALREPEVPRGYPLRLLTSAARDPAWSSFDHVDRDPGVTLHPSLGFTEGQRVRVVSPSGAVEATAHLDPGLRADVVDLPAGYAVDALALVPAAPLDPFVGTPALNGAFCRVEAA